MADLRMAGDAARRAAESLLRSAGGRAVYVRLAAPASPSDVKEQIGLGVPEFQDAELSPVVFRKARPGIKADGPRWELMVSAIAVGELVGARNATLAIGGDVSLAGAMALFANAAGVLVGESLMEIESVTSSDISGVPYVYRIVVKVPAADVI